MDTINNQPTSPNQPQPNIQTNEKPKSPKQPKPKLTTEQLIAQKLDELNRLKEKQAKEENGIKFVLGGLLLNKVKSERDIAKLVLRWIDDDIKRPADLSRLENLIAELKEFTNH